MDVTSWLARTVKLIRRTQEEKVDANLYREAHFECQELRKRNKELADNLGEARNRADMAVAHLTKAHQDVESLEGTALEAEEKAALAVARVADLQEEISYLKEQVKIYQTRLGLLPQERQGQPQTNHAPLKRGRESFAVAQARVQSQRTEEYWRRKAEAVDPTGTTGTTTTNTPAVSEQD